MSSGTEYAFDTPVCLADGGMRIRTAAQAADIVGSSLRTRFSMQGLATILKLEHAIAGDGVEEARLAFCSWATQEGLA